MVTSRRDAAPINSQFEVILLKELFFPWIFLYTKSQQFFYVYLCLFYCFPLLFFFILSFVSFLLLLLFFLSYFFLSSKAWPP